MNLDAVKQTYRRYAKFYDVLYGAVLKKGRQQSVAMLDCQPGHRVLEVGVGTGLSLPLYPKDSSVTGIDISEEMLEKARFRVEKEQLANVDGLHVMDAEAMEFPDASFDKVIAMYVATVVPNPVRLVDEMLRVCKPGGEIFIVNHFRSEHPIMKRVEYTLAPLSKIIGFRPDVELSSFLHKTRLKPIEVRGVNFFGYWTLVRCRKSLSEQEKRLQIHETQSEILATETAKVSS